MLNNDFYPTPEDTISEMLDSYDLRNKVICEPSAGSGNLVRGCLERGAQEVFAYEIEPNLCSILRDISGCFLLGNDWLKATPDDMSHIDYIVMNPPFSKDEDHVLHAWEICPEGCTIISLCNWETCNNTYYRKRGELKSVIEQYGSYINLGNCFEDAERRTDVEIGLVTLRKPGGNDIGEFEGFFFGPDDIEAVGEGMIKYRRSRDLVNRYIKACEVFDEQVKTAVELRRVIDGVYTGDLAMQLTLQGSPVTKNRFRKELQKSFWKVIFDEMLPLQMATSQLYEDINKFVERQSHVPFTERNIYRMLQIIAGTQEQRIDRAVEEVFDKFTKHTYENRWGKEGWKTNEQFLLAQKFIVPHVSEVSWSGESLSLRYDMYMKDIRDLIKAMCYLTGTDYDSVKEPEDGTRGLFPNVWYKWGFFEFKVFKKGSGHFRFASLDDWAIFNKRVAKIKGFVLPEISKS
jgi:predicted RNA methylase